MRSHLISAGALALASSTLFPAIAGAATDPSGVWLDDKGRGAVEIKQCGDQLCGYVVWVKDASDKRGCGKQILGDVSRTGSGVWDNGWIYSPERKKRYNVELKLLQDDQLRVKGYAGTKFFSKTMVWTKAPPNINRCDVAALQPGTAPTPERNSEQPSQAPAVKPQTTAPAQRVEGPDSVRSAPQSDGPNTPAGADEQRAKAEQAVPEDSVAPQSDTTAAAEPQQQSQESEPEATDVPIEGGPDFSDLPIDKYFNKTADGRCKLNLPWVKLDFACPDGQ